MSNDDFDLGGEGGRSFRFETIGTTVTGKIISQTKQQATDFDTGEPASWPDGNPKWVYVINLQTDLRDSDDDDGVRALYLQGSLKPESKSSLSAVREAARKAIGSYKTTVGGTLSMTYVADGQRSRPQFNPPKQYEARYIPPSMSLDDDSTSGASPAAAVTSNPQPAAHSAGPAAATSQNGAGDVPGLIGWLRAPDGSLKPVDQALVAAFANAGVDVRSQQGFVPAP